MSEHPDARTASTTASGPDRNRTIAWCSIETFLRRSRTNRIRWLPTLRNQASGHTTRGSAQRLFQATADSGPWQGECHNARRTCTAFSVRPCRCPPSVTMLDRGLRSTNPDPDLGLRPLSGTSHGSVRPRLPPRPRVRHCWLTATRTNPRATHQDSRASTRRSGLRALLLVLDSCGRGPGGGGPRPW